MGAIVCTRIEVKQLPANFHRLDNREGEHSLNGHVMESRAATGLTPHLWTRNDVDLALG